MIQLLTYLRAHKEKEKEKPNFPFSIHIQYELQAKVGENRWRKKRKVELWWCGCET